MIESSSIFVVSVDSIRRNHCHLMLRTRDNAYRSHSEHKHKTDADRAAIWDDLKAKIEREGFDLQRPITIQLLRKDGKDKIKDGHHRFGIAVALNISEIPVRFLYDATAK